MLGRTIRKRAAALRWFDTVALVSLVIPDLCALKVNTAYVRYHSQSRHGCSGSH
jgi:hypothetical protein